MRSGADDEGNFMATSNDRIERAAHRLAEAYRASVPIAFGEAEAPTSPEEAMAVQTAVTRLLGATVGGWKVSIRPDGLAAAAPMYRHWTVPIGQRIQLLANGRVGIEPEIAVRLARDLPARPGRPYSRAEIAAAIDRVYAGIEIVMPRVADFLDVPFPHYLADNVGNAGYVYGSGTSDFAGLDLGQLRAVLKVDGKVEVDKVGGNPWGDPLAPLVACASAQMDGLGGFKAGQIVTTGSLAGLLWYDRGQLINLEIEGLGGSTIVL
jgi:2-keto-4-pentenoate hydratase